MLHHGNSRSVSYKTRASCKMTPEQARVEIFKYSKYLLVYLTHLCTVNNEIKPWSSVESLLKYSIYLKLWCVCVCVWVCFTIPTDIFYFVFIQPAIFSLISIIKWYKGQPSDPHPIPPPPLLYFTLPRDYFQLRGKKSLPILTNVECYINSPVGDDSPPVSAQ